MRLPHNTHLIDEADTNVTADNILNALEDGEADIFPDEIGWQMFATWKNDYRDLEALVSEMHHSAHSLTISFSSAVHQACNRHLIHPEVVGTASPNRRCGNRDLYQ